MIKDPFITVDSLLQPAKTEGVLMLHGMTGSAAEMLPLAHFLAEQGYQTILPTLSGHNTKVKDFKTTKTSSWIKDAHQGLEVSSLNSGRKIHLIGHSFGATLGLYLSLMRPSLIASLTLISPTLVIKPFWASKLFDLFSHFPEPVLDLMPLIPKRKNNMYCLVVPRTAYPVYSLGATARMFRIIRRVIPRLSQLSVRTLILRDPNDHLSHRKSLALLKDGCPSQMLEVIELEDAHHELLSGKHRQTANNLILKFIDKQKP